MNLVLSGLLWKNVLSYIDDVIVLGVDFVGNLRNLHEVFIRLRSHNLKLKAKKCKLFQSELVFLGRLISCDGVKVTEDKIWTITEWPIPKNKTDVESFLGFMNYHRDFIPNFSHVAECLYQLTGKKTPFDWTEERFQAFQELKGLATSDMVLAYPIPGEPFILDTDASDRAIGAVLSQVQDGGERPISFGSKVLTPAQRRYCTTRKELLAVIAFTRQYRHYLLGNQFTVHTDHHSLVWLMRFRNLEGQLARWLEELSQYTFQLIHRPGKLHVNADALSRKSIDADPCDCYHAGCSLDSLPCGGCKYCVRVHEQWDRFSEDVDDVVPLAIRKIQTDVLAVEPINVEHPVIPEYSAPELHKMQMEDRHLSPIFRWLSFLIKSDEELTEGKYQFSELLVANTMECIPGNEVALSSEATKYYWSLREHLLCDKGVLRYQWEESSGPIYKLIVPKILQEEILRLCHDTKSAGHFGVEYTTARIRRSFHWYKLRRDVSLYVLTCSQCSTSKKAPRRAKAAMKLYHAGMHLERVHIDVTGPFVESRRGNKLILVLIDQFTKWFECYAIPDQTAEVVCRELVNNFICRFGIPRFLHSDQGRNFESTLFAELCKSLEVAKTRTTPYMPSANGQIERYNRTLLAAIRCFVDEQHEWDEHLPLLGMAIRSTVNASTGCTPNLLMFGREISVPDRIFGLHSIVPNEESVPQYLRAFLDKMEKAHETARDHLKGAQAQQKDYYNRTAREQRFEAGDLVYKLDTTTKIGVTTKLKPVYVGPYLVTRAISSILYQIEGRRSSNVIHQDRLKLCRDRNVPLWMRRKRHQFLDTDAVVSLPEDPEDILSTAGILDEEPTMLAVGDSRADNTSVMDEDPNSATLYPTSRSG